MRPEYDGIKFFSDHDLTLSHSFEKARIILDTFSESRDYSDINEVIELYNIHQILASKSIKSEYTQPYSAKEKQLASIVACFFKSITDNTILDIFHSVCVEYIDDFWTLFNKFKVFNNISDSIFNHLLYEQETALYKILEHKEIVKHYDTVLAEFMRTSDQTARIIIRKFLERKIRTSDAEYTIPTSLKATEFESILYQYVESDSPNVGLLQLVASSQSSAECPISDELRLIAKKKAEQYWIDHASSIVEFSYGIKVCFRELPELISVEVTQPNQFQITYDAKWIKDNVDYPTLLNNFIHLFGYTDWHLRCSFPAVRSQLSVFERTLGVKGKKDYEIGTDFIFTDLKSSAEMQGYMALLSDLNIRIEDVYQWFFLDYLKDEFNASGFVFNAPSPNQRYLEKCRNLPAEMDGILKQYSLYVKKHAIDRELLEMSSKPIVFEALPSMTKNKYVYTNGGEILREQFLMFSDQSMLHYLPNSNKIFKSFFDAMITQPVTVSDYPEWIIGEINWMKNRGAINIDTDGTIRMNEARVSLLRDLYSHDVACPAYYRDKSEIEKLVSSGDLTYGSTLFSKPEQNYLNYMLNKSVYSNGRDLRNKYIHSTYPLDEQQQQRDYISLLKIMAIIIIKINEEFCLINQK